jgi:DNA (cytosine-5)-methyltransferase 1
MSSSQQDWEEMDKAKRLKKNTETRTGEKIYELALCAGSGGGILGGMLCGHTIIGAVEIEEYPREVLKQRQRDGLLDKFPIWDDVTTFTFNNPETREYINTLRSMRKHLVISAGFPCQDISVAGKGKGIKEGTRSGLWFEIARIIREIRPAYVFIENSPRLALLGGTRVIADFAGMGYNARWGVIGANAAGANHRRKRIWIVANDASANVEKSEVVQQEESNGQPRRTSRCLPPKIRSFVWQANQPGMVGTSHDTATWVDRSKAIGNGQVSAVVPLAWEILK